MDLTRRGLLIGLGATGLVAGCSNGIGSGGAAEIDARADSTIQYMLQAYPGTQDLMNRSAGMLVMPVISELGLGFGGSYGRGALRIHQTTVDYYSAASASAGFQIGAQQFSHVLFFMTQDALGQFRTGYGWAAGADVEYAIAENGDMLRTDTTTSSAPVIAVVFAQSGLRVGATIEGTKYSRIIP
ncbi:twin-arginine translocation pathway signal sequence domain protein, putative [Ketogulonicigenium vulgare Y25]|nr:twin-arginine translocation pathway signal sequence domain protein, putative [Ketogulonicigenium vulgare Y25]AOZ54131.1 Twin-arginine translocation pathway signal sequence domain protein, putative [Ketogulonicigenium vulgare]